MKRADIDVLETLEGRLVGIQAELGALSRKSPNDSVNLFKLQLINEVLDSCNQLLGSAYRPLSSFERFDADNLPSNSDVTFVIAQYAQALEKLRSDSIQQLHGYWYFEISDSEEKVRTRAPAKFDK